MMCIWTRNLRSLSLLLPQLLENYSIKSTKYKLCITWIMAKKVGIRKDSFHMMLRVNIEQWTVYISIFSLSITFEYNDWCVYFFMYAVGNILCVDYVKGKNTFVCSEKLNCKTKKWNVSFQDTRTNLSVVWNSGSKAASIRTRISVRIIECQNLPLRKNTQIRILSHSLNCLLVFIYIFKKRFNINRNFKLHFELAHTLYPSEFQKHRNCLWKMYACVRWNGVSKIHFE